MIDIFVYCVLFFLELINVFFYLSVRFRNFIINWFSFLEVFIKLYFGFDDIIIVFFR